MEAKKVAVSTMSPATQGGDGPYSYFKNSSYQKKTVDRTKEMISEGIAKIFDIEQISSSSPTKKICIADLGCSIGPNTFVAMQNTIEAIQCKYQSQDFEFQVFFNDQLSNDFNKLFTSLPPNKNYFAAAAPGTYHNRLFPRESLHFVHSSSALHWLSKIPEEVQDMNSPAFNKGRIYSGYATKEVKKAYFGQFVEDMQSFLIARAEELVSGGLMALVLPTKLHLESFPHPLFMAERCLMEMARKGVVSEGKVDSFNIPAYFPSTEEFEEVIRGDVNFCIEKLELLDHPIEAGAGVDAQTLSMHFRAIMECPLLEHFGSTEIIDELFALFTHNYQEFSDMLDSGYRFDLDLFVLLKRK